MRTGTRDRTPEVVGILAELRRTGKYPGGDGYYAVITVRDQSGKQQVVIANTGF